MIYGLLILNYLFSGSSAKSMIILICHYGGESPESSPFIASAKKIKAIIEMLSLLDTSVLVINTSCTDQRMPPDFDLQNLVATSGLRFISSPRFFSTRVSRFFSPLFSCIILILFRLRGICVSYVCTYNNLASEVLPVMFSSVLFPCSVGTLFYDDHIYARPKKWYSDRRIFDYIVWSFSKPFNSYRLGFAVNPFLADELQRANITSYLLPYLFNSEDRPRSISSMPSIIHSLMEKFKFKLLYSGALNSDKGFDRLLDLTSYLHNDEILFVTGSGPLTENVKLISELNQQVKFLGLLKQDQLDHIYNESNVFISLHPLTDLVFPFKIIEALYCGMIVVTTPLQLPPWIVGDFSGIVIIDSYMWTISPIEAVRLALDSAKCLLQSPDNHIRAKRVRGLIEENCSIQRIASCFTTSL